MVPSLSFKSAALALAVLGFTGATPPAPAPAFHPPVAARAGQLHSLTLARAPDGLFYVTAAVNGVPVRFVVDTGANVVVLTGADAAAAGVSGGSAGGALHTAGGTARMRRATIVRLTIGGHAIAGADAVIVGNDGPPHSLLGQSALSQLESVTLRGHRLHLR
jgi:aspartyl protease family protein